MITHNRTFFYKYVTAETAKKILKNLQIKWSSPILFNDPFDCQFDLNFGFSLDDMSAEFVKKLESIVYGEREIESYNSHPLLEVLKTTRKIRDKIPYNEFSRVAKGGLNKGINNIKKLLELEHNGWKKYIQNSRVFCVSEVHDDLLMWAHYAESHRGVVIKFKCIPELDTSLCAARPITYKSIIPVMASMEEWIEYSIGQRNLDFSNLFYDLAFTKSEHWSYEKEWRCFTLKDSDNNELYEMGHIYPQEIEAIYLGCRILRNDKEGIVKMLNGDLEHIKVFHAITNKGRFALDFE